MTVFCVNFQPERAPDLEIDRVQDWAENLARTNATVRRFQVVAGEDHLNLMFDTDLRETFGPVLLSALLDGQSVGPIIRGACIVVCEGAQGWDDDLLLHHFDEAQPLDSLT